ncbi:uncharacterized protein LOC144443903 [Glandiceps talaboti]
MSIDPPPQVNTGVTAPFGLPPQNKRLKGNVHRTQQLLKLKESSWKEWYNSNPLDWKGKQTDTEKQFIPITTKVNFALSRSVDAERSSSIPPLKKRGRLHTLSLQEDEEKVITEFEKTGEKADHAKNRRGKVSSLPPIKSHDYYSKENKPLTKLNTHSNSDVKTNSAFQAQELLRTKEPAADGHGRVQPCGYDHDRKRPVNLRNMDKPEMKPGVAYRYKLAPVIKDTHWKNQNYYRNRNEQLAHALHVRSSELIPWGRPTSNEINRGSETDLSRRQANLLPMNRRE